MAELNPSSGPTPLSESAARFVSSMTMTFEMWHDGNGYDLEALKGLSREDMAVVEKILIEHRPRDWRDIEALGTIDSPQAKQEIEKALKSTDVRVRQEAQLCADAKPPEKDRARLLIQSLERDHLMEGLGAALDEVAEFHPPEVVDALFRGALHREGEAAVHFAAMLFFIHGKASEPFDWNLRPFFLRFNTAVQAERVGVFREMCQQIGVDAGKYAAENISLG